MNLFGIHIIGRRRFRIMQNDFKIMRESRNEHIEKCKCLLDEIRGLRIENNALRQDKKLLEAGLKESEKQAEWHKNKLGEEVRKNDELARIVCKRNADITKLENALDESLAERDEMARTIERLQAENGVL